MIALEVISDDQRVGVVRLDDDGKVVAEPPEMEDIILKARRANGMTDQESFDLLRRSWSNGYWHIRELKETP